MRSTVISAKTVEECVNKALDKLQANRNEVNIEVIDEPKQGFLGLFGAKDAVVRVSLKDDVKEKGTDDFVKNILNSDSNSVETEQKEDRKVVEEVEETESTEDDNDEIVETVEIEETLDLAWDLLKILPESRTEGNMIKFNILCSQESDIGIIIGKRGETLDSLQYIVNLVTNRNADTYIRVILDCNQYRSKRERSLQKLARRLADKAIQTGRDIKLEPMNPYERRIIHTYLQNDENVNTFSQGNEPNRRVIIKRK